MSSHYDDFCERELLDQTGKKKCNQESHYNENYEAIVNQCMEVDTPIRIEVMSKAKGVKIECGKPIICEYTEPDCYRESSCEFVVKQWLHLKIPINYLVKADVAESYVKCKKSHDC